MKKINRRLAKFGIVLLTIFLILILTLFLIQKGIKEFDKSRVALVDKIGNNYVFRGNNPLVTKDGKTVFAYDELTSHFNDLLQKEGEKPLDDYYLIDVSLLDFDQYFVIKKEEKFFSKNPAQGELVSFSTLSPSLLIGQFKNFTIASNSVDNYNLWISDTLKKIHDLASKQTNKPVVIYIHCDAGRDRTTLIIGGYRLLFNNMPLQKIRILDLKEVQRSSVFSYNQAIRSYCTYVKKTYDKPNDYCGYVDAPK